MSGEAVKRQRIDEDTAVGFVGHITPQAGGGPERTPCQPDKQDQPKEKQHNRGNRK